MGTFGEVLNRRLEKGKFPLSLLCEQGSHYLLLLQQFKILKSSKVQLNFPF